MWKLANPLIFTLSSVIFVFSVVNSLKNPNTMPHPMPGEMPQVDLFTDGACSGNPGPGGWAYILRHTSSGVEKSDSGGEPKTTNNKMELLSVINGLNALDRPCRVTLWSDSQYVVKGLREWMDDWKKKGWKRGRNDPVKNVELWKKLDALRRMHQIEPRWVKGHNEHPENERCDKMAVAAIEQFQRAAPFPDEP